MSAIAQEEIAKQLTRIADVLEAQEKREQERIANRKESHAAWEKQLDEWTRGVNLPEWGNHGPRIS